MIRLHKPKTGLQQNRSLTNNAKMVQKNRTIDSRKNFAGNAFIKARSGLSLCSSVRIHKSDQDIGDATF